ncbi:MAG: 2,5-diamino-6-(ribosylamino)-4(3H)-pyrimidinone 5'-phosphate reductase [Nitrososphaerales archaeon]
MVESKPYVILNSAMSLDGKISTKQGDSEISCFEDKVRVHKIRSKVDAIMVGINTVLKDDPKLTVKYVKGKNPIRVIVDSKARIPLDAKVVKLKEAKTIVAVSKLAPKEKLELLRKEGIEIIECGEDRVDLKLLMKELKKRGIEKLLLEGGGNLNYSMFKEGLIDEVSIAIAPIVVGGKDALTLVEGEGFNTFKEGVRLSLKKVRRYGEDLVLFFSVNGAKQDLNI